MSKLEIEQIPIFDDNYAYLLHDPSTGATAAVDPALDEPVRRKLAEKNWRLTHIFSTHHHDDHIYGNLALKAATGCQVVGNARDALRIPGIDMKIIPGDSFALGSATVTMIDTPGHTIGHVAYWAPESNAVFTGDALFALGCGRLFEGTAQQAWESLLRLRALPDETVVYCGHEYTKSNARFAKTIETGNQALIKRAREIETMDAIPGRFVPFSLALEKETSPFLRADLPALKAAVGMKEDAEPWTVFAEIRRRKDNF